MDATALLAARYGDAPFDPPADLPPALLALLDRRVTRRYRPDPVPDALLDTLLAAAQSAPTKSDLQQYSIVVTRDAAKIAKAAHHAGTTLRTDPQLGRDGRIVTDGGRVLDVTACGATLAEAQTRVYEAVRAIRFNGAWYRRDIADRAIRNRS